MFHPTIGRNIYYFEGKAIKARIKDRSDAIKAEKKAREREAKEAALKVKCKGADKYKGVRPPQCNGGNPCQTCLSKWQALGAAGRVRQNSDKPLGEISP